MDKTVLHLIDTTGPGGAEQIYVTLADSMRDLGYQSVAVIRGQGWVCDQLVQAGLEPVIVPAKGSFNIRFLLSLCGLVRKRKVSLIHSHLLGSNVYAAMVGLITGVPVVATYHGMVDVNPNERFRRAKNWMMGKGISHYVAVSKQLAQNIEQHKLLDASKTSIIYNGIDCSRYKKTTDRPILARLGLDSQAVLVGSLGNVRPAKAYDVLVKAAGLVTAKRPNVHFVIAGHQKASLMTELDQLIDRLALRSNIHFMGYQDDSAAFLSQLDFFVLSSSSEGFSISTIEAMAAGLPVLVTRCGGPEEIVTHAENGWMVEAGSDTALAEGIDTLVNNPDMAQGLADRARAASTSRFDIQRMLSSYDQIYTALGDR